MEQWTSQKDYCWLHPEELSALTTKQEKEDSNRNNSQCDKEN